MHASAILILFFTACTQAQPNKPPATHPQAGKTQPGRQVTQIDPRIWSIHQSRSGDYWFGSNGSGAYRFDGTTVTQFSQEHGLCGNAVRNLYEDASGQIFIATTNGISKFDGKRLTTLELVKTPVKPEHWQLRADDLWMVLDPGQHGPVRYDGDKLYEMELTESPAAGIHERTSSPFSWDPEDVYSLYKDRRGHLWFGTAGAGLCRYDGKVISWLYEEQLTTTPRGGAFGIRCIFEDRAGQFWICNTRQRFEMLSAVEQRDGHTRIQYRKSPGLPDAQADTDANFNFYPSMIEDDAGCLWMACGSDGIWQYGKDGVAKHSLPDGSYACCIHQDNDGKLWVGTIEHGIYVFDDSKFERFALPGAKAQVSPKRR